MRDESLRDLRRRVVETQAQDTVAIYALAKALERLGEFEDTALVPKNSQWIEVKKPWREVVAVGVVRVKRRIKGEDKLVPRVKLKLRVTPVGRSRGQLATSGMPYDTIDRRRVLMSVERFLGRFVKIVKARPAPRDTACGACGAKAQALKLCVCGYGLCDTCFRLESHVGHRDLELERQRSRP